jgi:hypothetical protein
MGKSAYLRQILGREGNGMARKKQGDAGKASKKGGRKTILEALQEHLHTLSPDALRSIVMDEATDSRDFRNRLMERLTASGMEWENVGLRRTISDLLRFRDFIPYRQSNEYANQIERARLILQSSLARGHASEVSQIIEAIIPKLENALEHADDSNGSISDSIVRVAKLRLEVYQSYNPDPKQLAEKLFLYDISSSWKWFGNFDGKYDQVLGEAGKARYDEMVRLEWEKLPDLKAKDISVSSKRFALQTAMERIAAESGESELSLAVAKKDLSRTSGYLKVAKLLQKAGRDAEALAWAEKGQRDFGGSYQTSDFSGFLANAYHRSGRDADAIGIYWASFYAKPSCYDYESLRRQAELAGVWPTWRVKALDFLYSRIAATKENDPSGKEKRIWLNGILVEILISDQQYAEAWSQAGRHGCHDSIMRSLVEIWEKEHPADCIPVFKKLCENSLIPASTKDYVYAADELAHLRDVMARANAEGDFSLYMQSLRTKYKVRKNLMLEFDKRGFP